MQWIETLHNNLSLSKSNGKCYHKLFFFSSNLSPQLTTAGHIMPQPQQIISKTSSFCMWSMNLWRKKWYLWLSPKKGETQLDGRALCSPPWTIPNEMAAFFFSFSFIFTLISSSCEDKKVTLRSMVVPNLRLKAFKISMHGWRLDPSHKCRAAGAWLHQLSQLEQGNCEKGFTFNGDGRVQLLSLNLLY